MNVGPDVKRCLFDKYESVILTSATLSTGAAGERGGFDFFTSRIGLGDFDAVKLGSPFDYEKQVTIYVTVHGANMPILSRYGRLGQLYRKKLIKKAFAQQQKLL